VIHRCLATETDLRTVRLDDITEHYGETLRHWRENFVASAKLAEELGYDLRFRRMWELYLAYVEAGFREARIGNVQMVLAKPEYRGRPLAARRAAEHAVGNPVHQEARTAAR
jgi:cyclopropane-fatty-acyl-phospholipid synthase